MKEKNQAVPDEVLSKEFISQFKTEADVSKFLKQLHAQVLEKMLEGEMDDHLGYEKNSMAGNNTGNSRNGSYPKKIHTGHGESVISIPRDRNGVHFFSISISDRYTIFFTASSEGNESFDFVYFLIFPFRFSMRFVV